MSKNQNQIKILSWNINGIRAAIKKGFWEKITQINPGFFCLQEIKATSETMQEIYEKYQNQFAENSESFLFEEGLVANSQTSNYNQKWSSCTLRKGYSGVLIGFKNSNLVQDLAFEKLGVKKFDEEGRVLVSKFEVKNVNLKIALINCYYPQGGRGQSRIDYKLEFYYKIYQIGKKLKKEGYKLILTGDFNTTIDDIDLARPKNNRQNTGCLPEERLAFSWLLDYTTHPNKEKNLQEKLAGNLQSSQDFYENLSQKMQNKSLKLVDAFRHFYPDLEQKYTYWDQITRARERNVGWRIDMFLVDKDLISYIKSCEILDEVMGSDHCPVVLEVEF